MDKRLMHYQFPRDQIQLDGTMAELPQKIAAAVEDATDKAIVAAVLAAARAEEVTDLYLLDKTFIMDAIREKKERENPKPLTNEELRQMKEATPVWWQYSEKTGFWCLAQTGVVMVPSGRCYDISECEGRAYRHKPKEE